MTDKELLELAAKAAGYEWRMDIAAEREKLGLIALWIIDPMKTAWHPLDDDGDALRLAVKLRMDVTFNVEDVFAFPQDESDGVAELINVDNPYAATRRAIVRAAAELQHRNRETSDGN